MAVGGKEVREVSEKRVEVETQKRRRLAYFWMSELVVRHDEVRLKKGPNKKYPRAAGSNLSLRVAELIAMRRFKSFSRSRV